MSTIFIIVLIGAAGLWFRVNSQVAYSPADFVRLAGLTVSN